MILSSLIALQILESRTTSSLAVTGSLAVATEAMLKLYDPVGRKVYSEKVALSKGINEFNLSGLYQFSKRSIASKLKVISIISPGK